VARRHDRTRTVGRIAIRRPRMSQATTEVSPLSSDDFDLAASGPARVQRRCEAKQVARDLWCC
jgi:hypothetical protein